MRRVITPTVLLALAFSHAAHAGVAEKKEIKKISEGLKEKTKEMKKWCGNASLSMTANVAEKFKQPQIHIAATNILTDFFDGVKVVCADADYKAEVKKLTKINFSLTDKDIKGSPKGIFKLKGKGTMQVVVHVRNSLSNGLSSSVPNAIKKLY